MGPVLRSHNAIVEPERRDGAQVSDARFRRSHLNEICSCAVLLLLGLMEAARGSCSTTGIVILFRASLSCQDEFQTDKRTSAAMYPQALPQQVVFLSHILYNSLRVISHLPYMTKMKNHCEPQNVINGKFFQTTHIYKAHEGLRSVSRNSTWVHLYS